MRIARSALMAVVLFAVTSAAPAQEEPYTPPEALSGDWSFHVDPELPNVLLVGDSITVGYALEVRDELRGEANVFVAMEGGKPVNWGNSRKGMRIFFEPWLATTSWDVVQFNFGLHDICRRRRPPGEEPVKDRVNGRIQVPIDRYRTHLDHFATGMKNTGADLIWATTTVVPENEPCRRVGDEVRYNEAAASVMEKHGIRTNDLHALSRTFGPEGFSRPGDVHFSAPATRRLASRVAEAIRRALKTRGAGAD